MTSFKNAKTIAIDGPAGSGKSTVSKLTAERLGYMYVDTGAMYRALTLKVMKKNISFDNKEEIIKLSANLDLKFLVSEEKTKTNRVVLDGFDITAEIRKMEVTGNVKYVAKIPAVRENMVNFQRRLIEEMNHGAVMEGRDIGTVVLPGAKYKFYLDASFDERVERRLAELKAKGEVITRDEVANDLKQRDHTDKTRETGPLRKAADALYLDTTNLSVEEVITKIITCINP
ncbi:MAG: (d)CMP kinase [Candidatus Omnitrophota bacterium]